jgi:hypothetical protein
VYDTEGTHELEASIMDGSSGKAGAIAGATKIKNPISAAKKSLFVHSLDFYPFNFYSYESMQTCLLTRTRC